MAKTQRGLPDKFSLKVSAGAVSSPVDLGDYLDEHDHIHPARQATKTHANPSPGVAKAYSPGPEPFAQPSYADDLGEMTRPSSRVDPGRSTRTGRRPAKPRRKQINMRPETQKMADALLHYVQTYSPQADTKSSELFDALISVAYESRDHLDLTHVPPRGRWGTPTARAFTTAIKRAIEMAVVERYRAKRGEG